MERGGELTSGAASKLIAQFGKVDKLIVLVLHRRSCWLEAGGSALRQLDGTECIVGRIKEGAREKLASRRRWESSNGSGRVFAEGAMN